MGFTAEDTAEAIGLMANAGIKSSQAGTAMRSMMTNLTGEVKFVGDAFGELTIQTTNTDGSMRSLGDILADCRQCGGSGGQERHVRLPCGDECRTGGH